MFLSAGKEEQGEQSAFPAWWGSAQGSHFGFTPPRLAMLRCIELIMNKKEKQRLLWQKQSGLQTPDLQTNSEEFATEEANDQHSHHVPFADITSFCSTGISLADSIYLSPYPCPCQKLEPTPAAI